MAITTPVYCQRDTVRRAMDVATTARRDSQIDRLIQASARQIDKACNRVFYPEIATRYLDWPTNYHGSGGQSWQVWLDGNEMITLTSVTVGGVPVTGVSLEPVNYGPPYTRLEIDLASGSSFAGAGTWQRAIAAAGLYGYRDDEVPAGLTGGSLTSSQTTLILSDSSLVSPGALIRVGSERMQVSDATMVTTGVTSTAPLTASAADVLVGVGASASAFTPGETILLDGERMLIVDITGANLVVKRAWDGSVLAAHSTGPISALRLMSVTRGFLGTTPAAHSSGDVITRHDPPALVEQANVGLTLYGLGSEEGGMRPVPLTPSTAGASRRTASPITALMEDLVASYGRRARTRAI